MKTLGRFPMFLSVILAALMLAPSARAADDAAGKGAYLVYFGTYTRAKSQGIYAYRFDAGTGKLTSLGLAAEIRDPSFLAVHPNRRFLYAVSEIDDYDEDKSGSVSAFTINAESGKLTLLNRVTSRGGWPCHINVERTGKSLAVANYSSGSVAAFPLEADGRLGEASAFVQHSGRSVNAERQQGPHAHSADFSPDNRFLAVSDLGIDQVLLYRFDAAKSSLAANDPPSVKVKPGAGPRHFAFHPSGPYAYGNNELQSTVTAYAYDGKRGALKELQTLSTLSKDFQGDNTTAEIEVHRSGKFVYVSNRGHDSIAVFAIDEGKGTLQAVEQVSTQGKTPRGFAIDPTGKYLFAANQNSDNVVQFRIDANSGRLTPTGQVLEVYSPVCIKLVALE